MQNPTSRARRLARLPIARPLMLTVMLALASCRHASAFLLFGPFFKGERILEPDQSYKG